MPRKIEQKKRRVYTKTIKMSPFMRAESTARKMQKESLLSEY